MADDSAGYPADEQAVDGRDKAAIREDARERVPFYTGDQWDPDAGGPGAAVLELFSELAAGVVDRLDQVPAKHRAQFFDTLGFDREPPQSARLPLAVEISEGADGNVYLPGGSRAIAPASESQPELTFELTDGFEATPARLDQLISVDPALDHIATHSTALDRSGETRLFGGENEQRHRLYIGDSEVLALDGGATIQVRVESTADATLLASLQWEYYGETPEDPDADAGWRTLRPRNVRAARDERAIDIEDVAALLDDHDFELTTADLDSVTRWLVATLLLRERTDPVPPHVDPAKQPEVAALYRDLDEYVETVFEEYPPAVDQSLETVVLTFKLDQPVVESEQVGSTNNWLRASVPTASSPGRAARLRALELQNLVVAGGRPQPDQARKSVARRRRGVARSTFPPDDLLSNDVPLKVPQNTAPIRPFGMMPRAQDTFYISSKEVLTKSGQRGILGYTLAESLDTLTENLPHVSWEYWDGAAWDDLTLDLPAGSSADLFAETSGTVTFEIPDDFEPTSAAGHEGHWIRARLVGGGYGRIIPDQPDGESGVWQRIDEVTEPRLSSITLSYEASDSDTGSGGAEFPAGMIAASPDGCVTDTNLSVSSVSPETRFKPFAPPLEDSQTLYFGYDGPLAGGPLQLFLAVADFQYPESFDPRVRWEVSTDSGWERVSAVDRTDGLTEQGIVRFTPPTTAAQDRFGISRHWLRARVTAPTGFVDAPYRPQLGSADRAEDRCGDHLDTTPPGTDAAMKLPETGLVAHNAGMAANVRTITDEILGSSDATPGQEFQTASTPVTSPSVWVDELSARSVGERERLIEDPAVTVEPVGDEADRDAFWVAWSEVEDFLGSGPDDRHYTLDPITGTVTFGDGTDGAIPRQGRDNVRISYQSGGGAAGNVAVGAVSELEGSLAFVDGVTNPLPGDGGADSESTEAVLERAPKQLRDRNRAVAPADFERIALATARRLARARCLPGLDPRGVYRPGWVTVLLVPQSGVRKPVPPASLREQVTEGLGDHAPATLLGQHGDERLVVRGPSYVEVTIDATLVADESTSFAHLEESADAALAEYLHPLHGGDDGDGWPFGKLPCVSDIYGVLEGVAGVDHVAEIALRFDAPGVSRTIRPGQDSPTVDSDVLIHSGRHELAVEGGS
jgi:predicted phage baseplate assembly protein